MIGRVTTALLLILGLASLYWGAEWLVRGACRIARALSVSPLVIGLTVVAFGTSMPEMVAGVVAAWNGSTDIALGNVLGSNIANVGLILGIAALVHAIPLRLKLLQREAPIMLITTALVYLLAARGTIGRLEGLALFLGLVGFTWLTLRWAHSEREEVSQEFDQFEQELGLAVPGSLWTETLRLVAGLLALSVGAQLMVTAAVDLAGQLGVSEFLISVSMVAVGTSLPELATSLVAITRGEYDVLVGNIVGSNIFNLLGALGLAAVVRPIPVAPEIVALDLPIVLAFSLAMLAGLWTHRGIVRWEGGVLLAGYVAYLVFRFA